MFASQESWVVPISPSQLFCLTIPHCMQCGWVPIVHLLVSPGDQEHRFVIWWRHQMETFSALLAICAGNSPVPGEFPTQRPVTRSFDVFFDLRPNKQLSKQWWFGTQSCPWWRHRNELNGGAHLRYQALLSIYPCYALSSPVLCWYKGNTKGCISAMIYVALICTYMHEWFIRKC